MIHTGNRSPIADPRMRGSIVGLALVRPVRIARVGEIRYLTRGAAVLSISTFQQDDGLSDLARKFNVTLEAIALQTRHIVDEMNAKGHSIRSIYMSGGQAKNIPLMQLFADTCNMPVVLPQNSGAAVVLGAAMLGRIAAELKPDEANIEAQNELRGKIMVSCPYYFFPCFSFCSQSNTCMLSRQGRHDPARHARSACCKTKGEKTARSEVQNFPREHRNPEEVAQGNRGGLQVIFAKVDCWRIQEGAPNCECDSARNGRVSIANGTANRI